MRCDSECFMSKSARARAKGGGRGHHERELVEDEALSARHAHRPPLLAPPDARIPGHKPAHEGSLGLGGAPGERRKHESQGSTRPTKLGLGNVFGTRQRANSGSFYYMSIGAPVHHLVEHNSHLSETSPCLNTNATILEPGPVLGEANPKSVKRDPTVFETDPISIDLPPTWSTPRPHRRNNLVVRKHARCFALAFTNHIKQNASTRMLASKHAGIHSAVPCGQVY